MRSPLIGLHIYRRQSMALISKNFIVCIFVLPEEKGSFKPFAKADLLVVGNWFGDKKLKMRGTK